MYYLSTSFTAKLNTAMLFAVKTFEDLVQFKVDKNK